MRHRQFEQSAPKPNRERRRDAEGKVLVGHAWEPIQPLTERDLERSFDCEDEWRQRYEELLIRRYNSSEFWDRFTLGLNRLHHSMAIETGVIEGLYNTRQDVTETLLREGFDNVDHVRPESVDVEPEHLINILADHFEAHGMVMGFHQENRPFGKHAMRELHAKITDHQETHFAVDSLGRHVHRPLRKGAFKVYPNNPTGTDGRVHQYAPPEQVEPQLGHLLELYDQYREAHHPLLVGAWLHHRFIQIHPFADGNGRTGRMLLNWHLYDAGWLPVLVDRRDRNAYLYAMDQADAGNLSVLVDFLVATSRLSIRLVMHEFSAEERLQVLGPEDRGNMFRQDGRSRDDETDRSR